MYSLIIKRKQLVLNSLRYNHFKKSPPQGGAGWVNWKHKNVIAQHDTQIRDK